ncbi:hypothetical protein [Streptomyces sp. RPA4-5]|uniref:hypothetical protein n=1 Tax=Streptomyces sp. RPA4-5 TaxID=2721245 RepID=UPI002001D94A|nr:hypothetical protein [Streptomyces sp. RPA4-5]
MTTDPAALPPYDLAVITAPTSLRDGVPDLAYVETCAQTLGEHLHPGTTGLLESTTYPCTTEEVALPILENASGLIAGSDFHVGFSPERIDPGARHGRSAPPSPLSTGSVATGSSGPSITAISKRGHMTRTRTPVRISLY